MSKISVNFTKDENNNYIVERVTINSENLNKDSICLNCSFYSGAQCHGHGLYYGICYIYQYINNDFNYYDDIVGDKTKCKVFQYLKSLDDDYNEYINSEE